jgi:hypothetical protein
LIQARTARPPPGDHVIARAVCQPQQEIAVTRRQCAEAHQILAPEFADGTQQIVLIAQPCFVFGDDAGAIAVLPDLERIAPLAAAADIDGVGPPLLSWRS